jgi:glycosyltransferase involved in cell wall biosynthesis
VHPLTYLHLTDLYEPSVGGMERHVQGLTEERARRGHRVSIATLTTNGEAGLTVTGAGVRVHRLTGGLNRLGVGWQDSDKPHHPPAPDPWISRQIRRIVDLERPDVVHAHNWMAYSYLAIKRPSDPPLLWFQHDYALSCPKKTALFEPGATICQGPGLGKCLACSSHRYGRIKGTAITLGLRVSNTTLHRRIDRIVANSQFTAEVAARAFTPEAPIEVVPSFIGDDVEQLAELAPRPGYLPPDGTYVLFVGALGAHKGIYDLLEAYQALRGDRPPLVVLGAPQGDTPSEWPEGVVLRQRVPNTEVLAAWKRCAFGVVPSRWAEPMGQVAVEAGALGRAVVATDAGGLRDVVIDGKTGLLVPPGDPASLTEAMRRLIDDPALADRLGIAARRQSLKFRVGVVADRLDDIAAEMVAVRTGRLPVLSRGGTGEDLAGRLGSVR